MLRRVAAPPAPQQITYICHACRHRTFSSVPQHAQRFADGEAHSADVSLSWTQPANASSQNPDQSGIARRVPSTSPSWTSPADASRQNPDQNGVARRVSSAKHNSQGRQDKGDISRSYTTAAASTGPQSARADKVVNAVRNPFPPKSEPSSNIPPFVLAKIEKSKQLQKDRRRVRQEVVQMVKAEKNKRNTAKAEKTEPKPRNGHGKDSNSHKEQGDEASTERLPQTRSLKKAMQEERVQYDLMKPSDLKIKALDLPQPPVPYLEYGLDRVLFNPGVYHLQDPMSRVYNFDKYLEMIMPITEFDFDSLKQYKTSSQDTALAAIAEEQGKRYIGSTSSMTSTLSQFHFLLSNWRMINLDMLSSGFTSTQGIVNRFTKITKVPAAIFLRLKDGHYAIDADKEFDSANVLMLLGKSLELLLTLPTSDYEVYRKSDSRKISKAQQEAPESYQYTTMGDFLMRSQLDAHDPRLPGTGNFDLKTRAVLPIRMSSVDYKPMTGYELYRLQGEFGSYEREYYDMMRATMLKYMLQVRMGRMSGIFVAYHNITRMFGFQYVPLHEMDKALHGQNDPCLGDQEFKASLDLLNQVFNKATAKFPGRSLRLHFETYDHGRYNSNSTVTKMHIFAEPMTEEQIDAIQNTNKDKVAKAERMLRGLEEEEIAEQVTDDTTNVTDQTTSFAEGLNVPDETVQAADSAALDDMAAEDDTSEAPESAVENDLDLSTSAAEENDHSAQSVAEDSDAEVDEPAAEETIDEESSHAVSLDSSNAPADLDFLKEVSANNKAAANQDLFYATIQIVNKVNGRDCEQGRPDNLRPKDEWTIDYHLKEHEITEQTWAQYVALKARRKATLTPGEDSPAASEGGRSGETEYASFITLLRNLAKEGKKYRQRLDAFDKGKEIHNSNTPLPRLREPVDDVDSYMSWLYGPKL